MPFGKKQGQPFSKGGFNTLVDTKGKKKAGISTWIFAFCLFALAFVCILLAILPMVSVKENGLANNAVDSNAEFGTSADGNEETEIPEVPDQNEEPETPPMPPDQNIEPDQNNEQEVEPEAPPVETPKQFSEIDPDWTCSFDMDSEDETDIWRYSKIEYRIQLACKDAIKIQETLDLPLKDDYNVAFDYNTSYSAKYIGNGNIVFSHLSTTQNAFEDVILHEMVHSALEEVPVPTWLNEGLAERMVDIIKGKDTTLYREYVSGIENLESFATGNATVDTTNYRYANFAVKSFIDKYGLNVLKQILKKVREKQIWGPVSEKNAALVEAVKEITGDDSITLDKLVYPKKYSS